jgi:drug/metabolite transporter (DMT)-like permease
VIPLALGLVLLGAGMHATWNVLLKGSPDPLRTSQRALIAGTVFFAPAVLAGWLLSGHPGLTPLGWGCAAASAVAELFYFIFLSRAYRHGELSFVYPIARGTGPLVAAAAGLLLLHDRLSGGQLAGVLALMAGIWLVRRPAGRGGPLVPALLTGLSIGTYTVIDSVGVRQGPPWLFGWFVFAICSALLTAWVAVRRGRTPAPPVRTAIVVGVLMTAVFYLLLFALAIAPVSIVAPARESAIVLVSAWGVLRLREREGMPLKVGGAVAILAGVVLLLV